jgi:hypothetical protein
MVAGYYIFNNEKFSYVAAYKQSVIKSLGYIPDKVPSQRESV